MMPTTSNLPDRFSHRAKTWYTERLRRGWEPSSGLVHRTVSAATTRKKIARGVFGYLRRARTSAVRARWPLLLSLTIALAATAGWSSHAAPADAVDWIFVSDDDATPDVPGCDAHSVVHAGTGEVLVRGDQHVSPGRLTLTSDGSQAISACFNNGQFLYVLRRTQDTWHNAKTSQIDANILQGARSAVTPDDQGLLLSMGLYPGRSDLHRYELSGVTDYRLGQPSAVRRDISAAEIVFGRDPTVAIVLDFTGSVFFLDTTTLADTREPIPYERPSGTARTAFRNTNAAVSPDGRYLVINTGNRGRVSVIDIDTGNTTVLALPGLSEAWDLEFNYAALNHGLLAVHGKNRIGVFRFAGTDEPSLVADVSIRGQTEGDWGPPGKDYYRGNSIAWTGRGDGVIAAVRSVKEFRVWDLDADAPEPLLQHRFDFDTCTGSGRFFELDVITLNRPSYSTPLPSPTACSTPSPSASPTTPPSVTPTPSRQPTALPTPTASSTPTATSPPVPTPVYLPLALDESCDPEHKRADVVLVVDTSSSMAGEKLEDAKSAALAFVALMDLAPGRDQVALVRYDSEAEVPCRLTTARPLIEAAIRHLTSRSGTHIDKGLRAALGELQGALRIERNLPVVILLTDGVQTGTPDEELRAAAELREAGVRLYTVGLGADVDAAALREMAGDDTRYHFAPGSGAVLRIYEEIAGDILCPAPPGGFWPGR